MHLRHGHGPSGFQFLGVLSLHPLLLRLRPRLLDGRLARNFRGEVSLIDLLLEGLPSLVLLRLRTVGGVDGGGRRGGDRAVRRVRGGVRVMGRVVGGGGGRRRRVGRGRGITGAGRLGVAGGLAPEQAAHPHRQLAQVVSPRPPVVEVRQINPPVQPDVPVVLLDGHADHRPDKDRGRPEGVRRGQVTVNGKVVSHPLVRHRNGSTEQQHGRGGRTVIEHEGFSRGAKVRSQWGGEEGFGVAEDALGVAVDAGEPVD
mmetsp:Transcript_50397/g.107330  ORF Transcript_50397/g.107330 Transcript_50397/m.107330 type:complete len:257 (+) Transcript_50397:673-1443(+)